MSRLLRTLLGLTAIVALLGACGGDDDEPDPDPGEQPEALVDDACALLTLDQLDAVTGLDFDDSVSSRNQCIYTSSQGQSAISLNLTATDGRPADEALAVGVAECDADTVSELESDQVAGGFACLDGGVPTVVVITFDDVVYVLKGATTNEGAQVGLLLQQLSQLLAQAALG